MLWKQDPGSEQARVRFCIDFSPDDKDWETVSQAWSLKMVDFFFDIHGEEMPRRIERLEEKGGKDKMTLVCDELPISFFDENDVDLDTTFPLNKEDWDKFVKDVFKIESVEARGVKRSRDYGGRLQNEFIEIPPKRKK